MDLRASRLSPTDAPAESVIESLAARNLSALEAIFPTEAISAIQGGAISPQESRRLNEVLASALYSPEMARLIYARDTRALSDILGQVQEILMAEEKCAAAERILDAGHAALVIRPQFVHLEQEILRFLRARGFSPSVTVSAGVDFAGYFSMYYRGAIADSWEDFPTRTLCYINQPLRAVFFSDPSVRYGNDGQELACGFEAEWKGHPGSRSDTLRGGPILMEALRLEREMDPTKLRLAFDPIMAYRHLASGATSSDGAHLTAEYPFWFYAGAGVHVPDGNEFIPDLCSLFSAEELAQIERVITRT